MKLLSFFFNIKKEKKKKKRYINLLLWTGPLTDPESFFLCWAMLS